MDLNNQLQQPQKRSFGERVLSSIGSGLDRWAEGKIKELDRKKESDIYHKAGFRPEIADFLTHIREVDPAHFSGILQGLGESAYARPQQQPQQMQQPGMEQGGMQPEQVSRPQSLFEKSEDRRQKKEAHEQKLIKANEPTRDYLENLSDNIDKMLDLSNEVDFGVYSSLASGIPGVGQFLVDTPTGEYYTLSNEFALNSKNDKGVDSNARLKVRQAGKPGLNKSKEQNIKELRHWKQKIDERKNVFYKEHPYMTPYGKSSVENQNQGSASSVSSEGKFGPQARNKKTGEVFKWNPQSKKYDIPA